MRATPVFALLVSLGAAAGCGGNLTGCVTDSDAASDAGASLDALGDSPTGVDGSGEDGQPIDAFHEPEKPGCTLPSEGDAFLRLGNLIPAASRIDFCIKESAQASFDGIQPLLRSSGSECPNGLAYRDITTMFGVPAGTYEIIVVDRADEDVSCTGTPLAQVSGIVVQDDDLVDALVFGDSLQAAELRVWRESGPIGINETALRFVNALVGAGSLDCGQSSEGSLPATIETPVFAQVSFAAFNPTPGMTPAGSVDGNGYLVLQIGGATVPFAVANTGEADAFLVGIGKWDRGVSYTFFAGGRLGDSEYPVQALICDELKSDGILALCD